MQMKTPPGTRPLLCVGAALATVACGALVFASDGDRPRRKAQATPQVTLHDQVNEKLGLRESELAVLDIDAQVGQPFTAVIPYEGQEYTVDFHPHSVRSPNYQVWLDLGGGKMERVMDPEPVNTFHGQVVGMDGSHAVAAITSAGLTMTVMPGDGTQFWVEDCHCDQPDTYAVYRSGDVRVPQGNRCGNHEGFQDDLARFEIPAPQGGVAGPTGPVINYCAELGVDSDWEHFRDLNVPAGDGVANVQQQVNGVVAFANIQYQTLQPGGNLEIDHQISAIVIRTDPNDPYTSQTSGGRLSQFHNEWQANQGHIPHDIAALFGGNPGFNNGSVIGQADAIGGVCTANKYCVNHMHFNGITPSATSCMADLLAHEMGHLWNSHHTAGDTMTPSILCINVFHAASTGQIIPHRETRTCINCSTVEGACCVSGGDCIPQSPEDCAGIGGTYLGTGTLCEDADCGEGIPLGPDDCADAVPIYRGLTSYNTVGATTTTGLPDTTACAAPVAQPEIDHEIWFTYQALCPGNVMMTTCEDLGGSANYDTMIVVFESGTCTPSGMTIVTCNDDDTFNLCGTELGGFRTTLNFTAEAGVTYLVAVGGANPGNVGTGNLLIVEDGYDVTNCPHDFNCDGTVNQSDLGILLAAYLNDSRGDLDGDGDTDQSDLGAFLPHFGNDCPTQ